MSFECVLVESQGKIIYNNFVSFHYQRLPLCSTPYVDGGDSKLHIGVFSLSAL